MERCLFSAGLLLQSLQNIEGDASWLSLGVSRAHLLDDRDCLGCTNMFEEHDRPNRAFPFGTVRSPEMSIEIRDFRLGPPRSVIAHEIETVVAVVAKLAQIDLLAFEILEAIPRAIAQDRHQALTGRRLGDALHQRFQVDRQARIEIIQFLEGRFPDVFLLTAQLEQQGSKVAPQWALNRWGAWVSINLAWHRLDGISKPKSEPKTAPPRADSVPKTAPPDSDKEPLRESKNQEPATGGPTGFLISEGQGGENPPTLRDVVPADLRDTGRLLTLHAEAVGLGLVDDSESGRLKFVAAAEHARVIGTRNPSGLFVRLVRRKLWHFLTQDDEDAARLRLKRHLFGEPRREELPVAPVRVSAAPTLSPDARIVQAVKNAANRAAFRGDAFYLLRRERPDWTRDRWDAACLEMSGERRSERPGSLTTVGTIVQGLGRALQP